MSAGVAVVLEFVLAAVAVCVTAAYLDKDFDARKAQRRAEQKAVRTGQTA